MASNIINSSGGLNSLESSYTPTITGVGTPTNVMFSYQRMGNFLRVVGFFSTGVNTAAPLTITLPPGILTADSTVLGSGFPTAVGTAITNNSSGAYSLHLFVEDSSSILTVSAQANGVASTNAINGNFFGNGNSVSISAIIPIQG